MTTLCLFIRISQSFLQSDPLLQVGRQVFFPKTAKKSLIFNIWRTKPPQKFRLSPNFKNHVNLHKHTTCSKLRPASECSCFVECMWNKFEKRSFFNVVFSRREYFDMQSFMEQFRALVTIIQSFRAKWCKYIIGLILQSFIFQHVTCLYFFIRICQSFLQSNSLR